MELRFVNELFKLMDGELTLLKLANKKRLERQHFNQML